MLGHCEAMCRPTEGRKNRLVGRLRFWCVVRVALRIHKPRRSWQGWSQGWESFGRNHLSNLPLPGAFGACPEPLSSILSQDSSLPCRNTVSRDNRTYTPHIMYVHSRTFKLFQKSWTEISVYHIYTWMQGLRTLSASRLLMTSVNNPIASPMQFP